MTDQPDETTEAQPFAAAFADRHTDPVLDILDEAIANAAKPDHAELRERLLAVYRHAYLGDRPARQGQCEERAFPTWDTITNFYEVTLDHPGNILLYRLNLDLETAWDNLVTELNPTENLQPCGHCAHTVVYDTTLEQYFHEENRECFLNGPHPWWALTDEPVIQSVMDDEAIRILKTQTGPALRRSAYVALEALFNSEDIGTVREYALQVLDLTTEANPAWIEGYQACLDRLQMTGASLLSHAIEETDHPEGIKP